MVVPVIAEKSKVGSRIRAQIKVIVRATRL